MRKRFSSTWTVGLSLVLLMAGCSSNSGTAQNSELQDPTPQPETITAEAVTGASQASYTPFDQLKDTYDVVIIGAGGAGMTAAIQAKEDGMNPVIFEKMPTAGGNTNKSSSGMNASETKFQEEEGIEDSSDLFYEETLKGGKGTNDTELLRYFTDHSASAIEWLDARGITLNNLTITGGMSQKRTHRPEDGSAVGQYLVNGLVRNVQEQNIPLFVHANVKEITEKDGKVNGVKVLFHGEDEKIIHAKAVIVATGGYGSEMDMITSYRPDLKGLVTTNQEGSTGDGIKMIEALGGITVDMDQIQVHPTVQQEKSYLIGEAVRGEGAVLVSSEGVRFTDELTTRDQVTAAINNLPEKSAYLVFDSGVKSRVKAIQQYEEMGFVLEGETTEALADKMNVPADQLKTTIETWNKAVKNQNDTDYGRTTGMEHDLSAAPYYAIQIAPGIHYTMGGVRINTNTEVIKADGKRVPGLFAAGEVIGGLHGSNRIGGNSVGDIIVFGYQAGAKAAEYVNAE